jgi:hypothetical protein
MAPLPNIYDDDYEDIEDLTSSVYLGSWCGYHLDNPDEAKYLVGKPVNKEPMPQGTYILLNVVSYLRAFVPNDNGPGIHPEHFGPRRPNQKWEDLRSEVAAIDPETFTLDEARWPTNDSGNPKDPLTKVQHMHLLHVQNPKYYTLVLHTFSAFDSIRELMKEIKEFRGIRMTNTYAEIELRAQPAKVKGRWRTRPKFVLTNRWLPNPFVTAATQLGNGNQIAAAEAPKTIEAPKTSEPEVGTSSVSAGTIRTGNPNHRGEPSLTTELEDEIPF